MTLMILIFFFAFQGFNRLVAIALLFMAEEDAFWCLVYIIESLMPPEYYSRDKQLIGAQVDQVSIKAQCLKIHQKVSTKYLCERRMEFPWKVWYFSIKRKMMDISVLFSLTFSNFKNVKLWMHDKWSSRHTHLFCWTRKISFFFDVMSWVKEKVYRGRFWEGGEHFTALKSTLFENH